MADEVSSFLDLVESIEAREASPGAVDMGENVWTRDDPTFSRPIGPTRQRNRANPRYRHALREAVRLIDRVRAGITSDHYLREAMATSDFQILFGDVIDRQMLGAYAANIPAWRNYIRVGTVRDFRGVNRFFVSGGENQLAEVKELAEYPAAKLTPSKLGPIAVKKYGRRMPFSFETMINDDMQALTDTPARFALAARRSEARYATSLFVGASGPLASLYSVGNANIVTGNPALSVAGLTAALNQLATATDAEGEPILIDMVDLVVPPALQITAETILNAAELTLDPNATSGTAQTVIRANNWLRNRVRLNVNPYIPILAATANGNTSWFLFAGTGGTRPALEIDFIRGYEAPQMFMKSPNAIRIGGGGLIDPMLGDFDSDAIDYKIRHMFGGGPIDPSMTMGSNGSGA